VDKQRIGEIKRDFELFRIHLSKRDYPAPPIALCAVVLELIEEVERLQGLLDVQVERPEES
jgi:hypothetical protein